jgi:hypothetical protein
MEQAEDATTNHGQERRWREAVAELQGMRKRHNKRWSQRGGQAGRCEAEVPQEAMRQPAKAKDWLMGVGVSGAT